LAASTDNKPTIANRKASGITIGSFTNTLHVVDETVRGQDHVLNHLDADEAEADGRLALIIDIPMRTVRATEAVSGSRCCGTVVWRFYLQAAIVSVLC
jgi:hypothetical protein